MLARYKMYMRQARPPEDPLPEGIRQPSGHKTRHPLAPVQSLVTRYLDAPNDETWAGFEREYLNLLERRFKKDRGPFDELSALAMIKDVYIGCYCPTRKNPDVYRCHTVLALRFMEERYPELQVQYP